MCKLDEVDNSLTKNPFVYPSQVTYFLHVRCTKSLVEGGALTQTTEQAGSWRERGRSTRSGWCTD